MSGCCLRGRRGLQGAQGDGPQGVEGPQGQQGPAGAGGNGSLAFTDHVKHEVVDDQTESIVSEIAVNFDLMPDPFDLFWSGIINGNGNSGNLRVYTGGSTPGSLAGATLQLTQAIADSAGAESIASLSNLGIVNPTGTKLVQITLQNDTSSGRVQVRGQTLQ